MCIETMRMESRVLEVPADLTWDRYDYPDETKRLTNTVKFISILGIVFFSLLSESLLVFVLSFGPPSQ